MELSGPTHLVAPSAEQCPDDVPPIDSNRVAVRAVAEVRANRKDSVSFADRRNEALVWLASVLTRYAEAEQALGRLSVSMGLPTRNGSLESLEAIRMQLEAHEDRPCRLLAIRIQRWSANRPYRHLLAHGTLKVLADEDGRCVVAIRHLPKDARDVTPDRIWSDEERQALLHEVTRDSRSICDLVRNLLAESSLIAGLRHQAINPCTTHLTAPRTAPSACAAGS
jgi:hypothetical protein